MSQIGERVRGSEIGRSRSHRIYVYMACPSCGFARWIENGNAKATGGRCPACYCGNRGKPRPTVRGENSHNWKGGRTHGPDGYILVPIHPESPFFPMANKGQRRIKEHRLVMAQYLDRCLESWEVVHHINGNRSDNRLENLELIPGQKLHVVVGFLQEQVEQLRQRNKELETRVTLLESDLILVSRGLVNASL